MTTSNITISEGKSGERIFNGIRLAKIPGCILNALLLELKRNDNKTSFVPWDYIHLIIYGDSQINRKFHQCSIYVYMFQIRVVAKELNIDIKTLKKKGVRVSLINKNKKQ